jgi:Zn-dependent protease with chaperone function
MRRIMGALNKLSSREEILKKYASRFRDIPSSGSGFIWNPSIGLGYVSRYGYPDTKARVYLYRDSTWGLFDIQPRYFRSIEPCDKKVVRELEKLAFPAEVRIINERSYNAFAQGTSKTKSRVCFYSALVRDFKEPEIEGILGHELSHLYHNDCRLSVTYNHIVTIFNFLQIIFFSIGMVCFRIGTVPVKRRRKGGGGEAFIQLGFLVSGLFLLLCYLSLYGARITACILQFALSRQAEYRADQSSAALIGKQKMIAALEHLKESPEPKSIFPRLRSSLTVDPVSQMKNTARFMESIFATHPPLGKRIRALEAAGIS